MCIQCHMTEVGKFASGIWRMELEKGQICFFDTSLPKFLMAKQCNVSISTCEGIALQKANMAVDSHTEFGETP